MNVLSNKLLSADYRKMISFLEKISTLQFLWIDLAQIESNLIPPEKNLSFSKTSRCF